MLHTSRTATQNSSKVNDIFWNIAILFIMSFPKEPIVIQPEEISRFDVIIEDRKLVARGGTELATQESNTAAKASYYFRLIESLASTIRSKEKIEKIEWNLSTYHRATERIMNLVAKANTPVPKRFIWFRQFPHPHYVVMTREQTVNKLANDLDCEIRKLKARESSEGMQNQQMQKKKQKPAQKRYGHRLILKVCRSVRKGMSPYKAALLLDRPFTPNPVPFHTAEEGTAVHANDWQESESERGIRLLLRHRFLACIRAKKCIFDLSNALLSMWDLPTIQKDIPAKNNRKKKKVVTAFSSVSNQKVAKVQNVHAPSIVVEHNSGPWSLEERTAFLTGLEEYGFPKWKDIASAVPTRYVANFCRHSRR
jgi:Myb-like DNA-binding domain